MSFWKFPSLLWFLFDHKTGQATVEFKEVGDTLRIGFEALFFVEFIDGFVLGFVGFEKNGWHGEGMVQIRQTSARKLRSGI